MDLKYMKLKITSIMAKMKTQLQSMKNIKITMQVIIGKLLNKLRKIAINPLELKIETTIISKTNTEWDPTTKEEEIAIMLIL